MAAVTPVKMVTFRLPNESPQRLESRTTTPDQARTMSPPAPSSNITPEKTHPRVITEATRLPSSSISPQLAEIVSRALTAHPGKKLPGKSLYGTHSLGRPKPTRPELRPGRPELSPGSEKPAVVKEKESHVVCRDRSPLVERQMFSRMSPSQVTQVANQVRERANASCHEHIRSLKYEVAKLREHLLRLEEEIKHLNRGRHTLEIAIQDMRKALSVNQQSLSTQQKKSRDGQVCELVKKWLYCIPYLLYLHFCQRDYLIYSSRASWAPPSINHLV